MLCLKLVLQVLVTKTHDIGFRGTLGARKTMGNMTVGLYYQSEQEHQYDNLHVTSMDGSYSIRKHWWYHKRKWLHIKCNQDAGTSGVCRQDVEVEQPWNVGLGVSMDMGNNS